MSIDRRIPACLIRCLRTSFWHHSRMNLLDSWHRILPDAAVVNEDHLFIGRHSVRELAAEFGTPLYIYDAETLRSSIRAVLSAFEPLNARVSFAAKACALVGVLRIVVETGLNLDVVSEGELEAGLRAGFTPDRLHLHGNYKSTAELRRAVELGLHAIVVDNLSELVELERLAAKAQATVRVMLRVSPPLRADTHPHLQTSGAQSKFGFYLQAGEERAALELLAETSHLTLRGFHLHLGSQIFDPAIYKDAALSLAALAHQCELNRISITELSVGGGWGIPYRPGDGELSPLAVAGALSSADAPGVRWAVEPGRAIVARSGVAIYRVGSIKSRDSRRIVAVDGGMGDNPRPALYGAAYSALLVSDPCGRAGGQAQIVGRYCESGDVLVHDAMLPEVRPGDLLCIPMAGAYQLAMASGYNLVPPPAALLVDGELVTLIQRRATVHDLLARDLV
jgi:diaminopimelate decarboxylase